jgi:ceramide glucosyltransferase
MSAAAQPWLVWCGTALAASAAAYTIIAWLAMRMQRGPSRSGPSDPPPLTVLKPLCGAEHELYDCLRSFCDQDYPRFQIICGVRDADDPALAAVRALQREFPACDLQIAVDPRQHGSNGKVSNLINMMHLARYDYLVIADSDVRVTRGYLAKVVAPLLDPGVGIVTCAYRGCPAPGLWSLLESLFINDWFMPSVRVAALSGSRAFAFGATIAMRRDVLAGIGGFASIADQLADDYRLGELTRRMGLRTVLSEVMVETCVDERTLRDLVRHELRWLRTIRTVRPVGYALSFVTFGIPVAALGCALASGARPALDLLGIGAVARLMLHWAARRPGSALSELWVLPLNDTLVFALWCWGLVTRRVHWRNSSFRVARDGSARPIP